MEQSGARACELVLLFLRTISAIDTSAGSLRALHGFLGPRDVEHIRKAAILEYDTPHAGPMLICH
jgi:hypothetical protein